MFSSKPVNMKENASYVRRNLAGIFQKKRLLAVILLTNFFTQINR